MKMQVTANLNKEKAIEMVVKELVDCHINYEIWIDIYQANSLEEAAMMGDSASFGMPDFEEEAKEKFKALQKEKARLSKLHFHEILEIGESKGLWKQTEKQKRLIQ